MRRSLAPKRILFLTFIFLIMCMPAYAVWAFLSDAYDKPFSFDSIWTLKIMPPKVIEGDYQLFQNKPIDENTQGYEIVSKAVHLASNSALSEKGFCVIENSDALKDNLDLWREVTQYTDAGKPLKSKIRPYFSPGSAKYNVQKRTSADALIFFQIFGKFSTTPITNKEVAQDTAITVAGAAASMALTGFGTVVGGAYEEYDYKISIFDTRTGELIWFREGHDNKTDVGSVGRMTASLESVLKQHLPKCRRPMPAANKFKVRRSELLSTKNGGVHDQTT